ncbi:MAG: MBL fold metallo-hydrolase [Polyangiaceae bacterium]
MDWRWLGHAMWLVDAGGLRIAFDPLLEASHHGGVFETFPGRRVDAAGLRPDFVVVSHRHPDHFDVASLRALAAADADTVLLSPDTLVVEAGRRLGFRTAHVVPPGTLVELPGVRMCTTPSVDAEECGALLGHAGVTVWNQVDSAPGDAARIAEVVAAALGAVGRPAAASVDLAMLRWQPLREVAAALGETTAFPFDVYGALLDEAAAAGARAVVPAAAGVRHASWCGDLNGSVYPISEARFRADLSRRAPGTRVMAATLGGRYCVGPDGVELHEAPLPSWLDVAAPAPDPRAYLPLEWPPLRDAHGDGASEVRARRVVDDWVLSRLTPALRAAWSGAAAGVGLSFVLDVVFAGGRDAWTVRVDASGARVTRELDPEWDVLDRASGALLCDVIEGRRHWGDLLLSGSLRGLSRAYRVDAHGLIPLPVAPLFVYHAISYEESVRRAIEHQVGGRWSSPPG